MRAPFFFFFFVKVNMLLLPMDVMYVITLCWTNLEHTMIYKLSMLTLYISRGAWIQQVQIYRNSIIFAQTLYILKIFVKNIYTYLIMNLIIILY